MSRTVILAVILGCFSLLVVEANANDYDEAYDFNKDGVIDAVDLLDFQQHWQAEFVPTPTPVPNDVTIMLPGAVPMEFALIPAGSFVMGSSDPGWSLDRQLPEHEVTIGYSFFMGKMEVTQEQWQAMMGTNPSVNTSCGWDCPVEGMSWEEITSATGFLAGMNGLGQGTFRLPSEAEWEYACRAGTATRFFFGDGDCAPGGNGSCQLDDYAWWKANTSFGTQPTGQKTANAFGLFDMYGNVWEWCQDYFHTSYLGAPTDGSAWNTAQSPAIQRRVIRGGYYANTAQACTSSYRDSLDTDVPISHTGFRVVREP